MSLKDLLKSLISKIKPDKKSFGLDPSNSLSADQELERQIGELGIHYYQLPLNKNEFTQIRVKREEVSLRFRILDKDTQEPLATMYGLVNDTEYKTLSFIAPERGVYKLEIAVIDTYSLVMQIWDVSTQKGSYIVRREASQAATPENKRRVEAERLFIGGCESKDIDTAIMKLSEAESGWRELEESGMALRTSEIIYLLKRQKADIFFNIAVEQTNNNPEISPMFPSLMFQEALAVFQDLGDQERQATCLGWLGKLSYLSDENQKALEYSISAIQIFREIDDKWGEVQLLISLGTIYSRLDEYLNALECAQSAVQILRENGDQEEEAATLIDVALYYRGLGDREKAIENFKLALPILRETGNEFVEARTLNRIGADYWSLRESRQALNFYNEALEIFVRIENKDFEARVINNIGETYHSLLRDFSEALKYFNLALQIRETIPNEYEKGKILNNVGTVHFSEGNYQEALDFYNRALSSRREVGNEEGAITTLTNIGQIYRIQNEDEKALEVFLSALEKANEVKKNDDGYTANLNKEIGTVFLRLGNIEKGMGYLAEALSVSKFAGDKISEADVLGAMAQGFGNLNHRRMALFFYKLFVNKLQEMRDTAQGLDSQTQKLLLSQFSKYYKVLASIMISDEEYALAIQVLSLYQDQQFFDFSHDLSPLVKQIPLTRRERSFADKFHKKGKRLGQIRSQIRNLQRQTKNREPNADEISRLKTLDAELEIASGEYYTDFNVAYNDFTNNPDEDDKVMSVDDVEDMQSMLRELDALTGQKNAILYTLIDFDKFHILLVVSGENIKHFESSIEITEFSDKITQFYALLQSPTYDPRIIGKELYTIIFQPVESELKERNIQTLMWQLDGNLRYVPMAALFDGEKFLVEKYQNVVITRAEKERMIKSSSISWTGVGFGHSQEQTVELFGDNRKINFSHLPGVASELQSIFGTDSDSSGILPGEVFLNKQFTKKAFYEALKNQRPLIHISSHFLFCPGDDSNSFLLLSDGALTLSEMKKQTDLFYGVELLTLSACNTAATQADAKGREIDGFAELAQRLGAGAVLATLWQVSDNSTPWLMSDFYQRREKRKLNKAQAIQEAQIALLKGDHGMSFRSDAKKGLPNIEIVAISTEVKKTDEGVSPVKIINRGLGESPTTVYINEKNVLPYKKDDEKPFTHPYYWSAFILIGNWR